MLVIVYSDTLRRGNEATCHVGSPIPSIILPHRVEVIQADGHELEKIIQLFTTDGGQRTIPVPDRRVVAWYGDTAKTIVAALQGWRDW
jgi:hypothetical protein